MLCSVNATLDLVTDDPKDSKKETLVIDGIKLNQGNADSPRKASPTEQKPSIGGDPLNGKKLYIVQLEDDPVVLANAGNPEGMSRRARHVVDHVRFLQSKVEEAIAGEEDLILMKTYAYAFNGFSAFLSEKQADALKKKPGVVNVWVNELSQPETVATPPIVGLSEQGQAWMQGYTGEDVGKCNNLLTTD